MDRVSLGKLVTLSGAAALGLALLFKYARRRADPISHSSTASVGGAADAAVTTLRRVTVFAGDASAAKSPQFAAVCIRLISSQQSCISIVNRLFIECIAACICI